MTASALLHFACPACGASHAPNAGVLRCACGSPVLARYDPARVPDAATIAARPRGMWRWAELLPVRDPVARVTLGEGDTPLLPVPRLGEALGLPDLWVKDEGRNPTGSFKARGLAVAVALAREAGATHVGLPTAGNAGGAAAAYAAAAGLRCTVAAPEGTPTACLEEVRRHGAELRVVGRHIGEAAQSLADHPPAPGWRPLATFGEPGRVEGKKTITLEIAEAFPDGRVDALIFPTGGGTGVVAARKALAELEALGRRSLAGRPKLVAVQAAGCQPIVRAFERGASRHEPWPAPEGPAGLRVPDPLGGALILQALRETGGAAVAIAPADIARAQALAGTLAGLSPCLEAAAGLAAIPLLLRRAVLAPRDRAVVVVTGDRAKDPAA